MIPDWIDWRSLALGLSIAMFSYELRRLVFPESFMPSPKRLAHPLDDERAIHINCALCGQDYACIRDGIAKLVRLNEVAESVLPCTRCERNVTPDIIQHPWVKELIVRAELLKQRDVTAPALLERIREEVRDDEEERAERVRAKSAQRR